MDLNFFLLIAGFQFCISPFTILQNSYWRVHMISLLASLLFGSLVSSLHTLHRVILLYFSHLV